MTDDEARTEFLLEEYKSLRAEIQNRFVADYTIHRNHFLLVSAIVAIHFSSSFEFENPLLIVVAIFAAVFALLQRRRARIWSYRLGDYIKTLEHRIYQDGDLPIGWEHFLEQRSASEAGQFTWWNIRRTDEDPLPMPFGLSSSKLDYSFWLCVIFALVVLFLFEIGTKLQ